MPSQAVVPPGAKVRAFTVEEHGPLVWIWMGTTPPTDGPPHPAWIDDTAGWIASRERMHLRASYVRLHENLLDLTHLSFLHARSLGTPDYATSTFVSPALHEVHVRFHACDRPEHEQPSRAIRTAHIVTPETATTTHYLFHHGRNFALDDDAVTAFMHTQLRAAFQEDIDGLEAVERNLANYAPGTAHEISFRADAPSLAMRRWLKRRAGV